MSGNSQPTAAQLETSSCWQIAPTAPLTTLQMSTTLRQISMSSNKQFNVGKRTEAEEFTAWLRQFCLWVEDRSRLRQQFDKRNGRGRMEVQVAPSLEILV
jgi:hypothetical protein